MYSFFISLTQDVMSLGPLYFPCALFLSPPHFLPLFLLFVIQMEVFVWCLFVCAFLQVSHQNPVDLWTLLPHSMFDLSENITHSKFKYSFLTTFNSCVSSFSFGCGSGWHGGPAAPELPGAARRAHGKRHQE